MWYIDFLMGNLRAYGGCLGSKRRRRTWRGCDKFRGGAKQPAIRKSPNGETLLVRETILLSSVERTQGSETSQYLEEKKTILARETFP